MGAPLPRSCETLYLHIAIASESEFVSLAVEARENLSVSKCIIRTSLEPTLRAEVQRNLGEEPRKHRRKEV